MSTRSSGACCSLHQRARRPGERTVACTPPRALGRGGDHLEHRIAAAGAEVDGLRALEGILRPQLSQADIIEPVMSRVAELVSARPPSALTILAGWWKVPALALASCAVYALCVETGLLPGARSQLVSVLSAYNSSQKISAMLFFVVLKKNFTVNFQHNERHT